MESMFDLDKMVTDAKERLARRLDADVNRHHKEVSAAFAEARKRLLPEQEPQKEVA